MSLLLRLLALALVLVAAACGPSDDDDGGGTSPTPAADEDGDFISDENEGRADNIDTDGDGTPDYLDDDSDGDGIPDSVEAGVDDNNDPPRDSDRDGIPDFLDADSDDNVILDAGEGTGDRDEDGILDFADVDNDGDNISDVREIAGVRNPPGTPANPADSDGDGFPDYMDFDSDNDLILDLHESAADHDLDGIPSYLDLDSDGDCIRDRDEAGDAVLSTPPVDTDNDRKPNFIDRDSDSDGLPDAAEDRNCNGILDPGETRSNNADTDGDGVSDLIEVAAGTNPQDPAQNPRANGDFVFVVPHQESPDPSEDDLDFTTNINFADIYLLIDRSESMSTEINNIVNNVQQVANRITCPPMGSGTPGECIPDVFWGAGTIGYSHAGADSYVHEVDVNSNPARISQEVNTSVLTGSPHQEPSMLATYATLTGEDKDGAQCTLGDSYPARLSCASSPFTPNGIGYPCFRPDALPIILLATDEPPIQGSDTLECPGQQRVCAAANDIGARIIGIKGNTFSQFEDNLLTGDLTALATCSGAVDSDGNPLVEEGDDANAADAIESAIRAVARGVPLDLTANVIDNDPSDGVDAAAAFISHLETQQLGTPECTAGLQHDDTNGDQRPDRFLGVITGTPVCWRLVPRVNTTVEATVEPQMFLATVQVRGDFTLLDTRRVFFLVPPEFERIIVE